MKTLKIAIALIFNFQFSIFNCYTQSPVNSVGSGCSLEFDGVNNYTRIADSPVWDFNSFTVEAWININQLLGYTQARIINHQENGYRSWGLEIFGNGYASNSLENNLAFHIGNGSYWVNCVVNSYPIIPNEWYHIAGIYDYSTNSMYIYINGILTNTCPGPTGGTYININSPIIIGKSSQYSIFYWPGQIDEVRIWNRALTQAEIQQNMCRRLTGTEPGLVGYWRFDDCGGNIAIDSSPNGNNGTLY